MATTIPSTALVPLAPVFTSEAAAESVNLCEAPSRGFY